MISINKSKCIRCGACVGVCPKSALRLKDVVVVDNNLCIECGACAKACPANAITLKKK